MSARDAFAALCAGGLEPVLAAARERIRKADGLRGAVALTLSRRQQEELANLIRLPRSDSGTVRIDLVTLDEGLRRSRFAAGLPEVLAAGYGTLTTRGQERAKAEGSWQEWLRKVGAGLPEGAARWFAGVSGGGTASGRWVRRAYGDDPARAARTVKAVGAALANLPSDRGEHELLAVFAARLTGDPHAFDGATPGGTLLNHALAERFPAPETEAGLSAERTFRLDMAGLGTDQVSSTVLTAYLAEVRVEGAAHPVVRAMAEYGSAWRVTLGEVRRWQSAAARGGRAYVVENPPVFEYLLERVEAWPAKERPTLICTEGFLSAAAVRLLDLLAASGAEIWYGGDFDRNGLLIATWVLNRYPLRGRAWRMAPEDYRAAATGGAGEPRLSQFGGPLAPTADAVAVGGVAYQERLVAQLLGDLGSGKTGRKD